MDYLNELLSSIIINFLAKHTPLEPISKIKIKYTILVILCESEKIILLSLIFILTKHFFDFLQILICLTLSKRFIGGIHLKTTTQCFLFTLVVCECIIHLKFPINFTIISKLAIYFLEIVLVVFFAPLCSKNKIMPSKAEQQKLKIKGVISILFIASTSSILRIGKERFTLYSLLTVEAETLIVLFISKRRWKNLYFPIKLSNKKQQKKSVNTLKILL
ncbi:accessory gene regulator B family protein [Ruminococcus sp.]|uniref:accessory gene regulator B family protein n=1 Tax=Ruminococcus sp. TaxID=41978 RepID=UPI00352702F8